MKKLLLKALVWGTKSILFLAVLGALAAAVSLSWLGSDQGRIWLAGQIEQHSASDAYTIKIGDIQALNTHQIILGSLTLHDKNGAWLLMKDIKLDYTAKAFLKSAIQIDRLDIGEIELLHLPEEKSGETAPKTNLGSLPDIPRLRIDQINIETITLPATLSGETQTLSLKGKLNLSPALTGSAIEIHLLDKTAGQPLAALTLNLGHADKIALRIHIQDQDSKLIEHLTGLPSLVMDLDGNGTKDEWQGDLSLDAGEVLHAENKVRLNLKNTGKFLMIDGTSRYEDVTVQGQTTARININAEKLSLDFTGDIKTPDITLNDLHIQAALAPDRTILGKKNLSKATLTLTGKTGTLIDPQTSESIDMLAQADFEVTATRLKDKIHIEKSRFKTELFETMAHGEIDISKKTLTLSAQTNIPHLKKLEPEISGAADIRMNISGTYEPMALSAPLEIKTSALSVPWPDVSSLLGPTPALTTTLSYADNGLVIKEGKLRGQELEKLTFSGTHKDGQTSLALATHYKEYDLKTKLQIKDKALSFSDLTAHGSAGDLNGKGLYTIADQSLQASLMFQPDKKTSLSLDLSGPLSKLSGKGVIKGKGAFPYKFDYTGAFEGSSVTLSRFAGTYGPNAIALKKPANLLLADGGASIKDLSIGLGDGTFTATGSLGAQDFNVAISAENIPANLNIFPFLFDGRMAGKLSLSGPYKNPQGQADFQLKRIAIPALKDTQDRYVDGTVSATYKDSVIQTQADLQGPAGLHFKAKGHLPLTISPLEIPFDKPIQGTLNSAVDLRALTILLGLDTQRITGETALDVALSGTLNNPVIKGTGRLRNATYENLLTGTALKDIAADIQADKNRLTLTNLTGKDRNGGRFTGSGHITLEDIHDPGYDFSLHAEQLQLANLDRMGLMASGHLTTTGNKSKADVKGDITINHAEYYIGEIMSTNALDGFEIIETNGEKPPAAPLQKQEKGPEITLAVNIDAKNNIFVRSPDLETEWSSDLTVSGTTENPVLKGNLTLIRGQFQLLDTPVTLSKGAVRFINPDPTNPALDITGTIKGREMDALLKIGGEAHKPTIGLSSEPALPEDEILAKTLFGKSLSQLSPVQALRIAQLMASLSGNKVAGFNLLDKIRRAIGIDTLNVGLDDENSPTLSVGKYINDRVYIAVDQGSTPGSSAIRTEIEVRKDIDIETVTDNNGENSVGVNWKHDY